MQPIDFLKALGVALSVLFGPRKGNAGAKALNNVVGANGPIHAVIELLNEADWRRLRDCALGVDAPAEPGR